MNEIDSIKEALRNLIQLISERGEPLSDEVKNMLGQVMEHAANRIQSIRQQEQSQQAPPQPPQAPPTTQATPSADAQLLWILAGQQEDAFISYLNTFPSNETQRLLQNPTLLEQTINFLHEMMPSGQPPVINGIRHTDINSSNVWGTAYNTKTGQMKVRFQGGSEYEYDGVPANIYNAFVGGQASAKTKGQNQYGAWWPGKNPSVGAALNLYIKANNFPYRRLR